MNLRNPVTPATDPAVAHLERDLDIRIWAMAQRKQAGFNGMFSLKRDDYCRHQQGRCYWGLPEAVIW